MKNEEMKEATSDIELVVPSEVMRTSAVKTWQRGMNKYLIVIGVLVIVASIILALFINGELNSLLQILSKDHHIFYWMVLVGFLAEIVAGSMGMGYGVICTTVFLMLNIPPPIISATIHSAESFTTAAGSISHYKFGNVNKKLFKALLIPGIIGAIVGAWLLSKFGTDYAPYFRPILASYTLLLGLRILLNAFRKNRAQKKVKRVGWLAGAGGFLDSFGGGGWGPLVTSTLISKGRTPKYVIGTVSITEFFVTLASAITFFSLIGLSHWQVIIGLIIGGVTAAPLAAKLAGKLPLKTMFISVGALVIIWSLRILLKSLGVF
jgi:uncharacterized protein